jgi:L-alanine-DL-glutamate epimerase-like enolase superfamily enzyme
VDRIRGIIREERSRLTGKRAADFPAIAAELRARHPSFPMTVSGLETAVWRAWLRNTGTSEPDWFGGALRRIETDITIPHTTNRKTLEAWTGKVARKGFTIFKIKVSGEEADDSGSSPPWHPPSKPSASVISCVSTGTRVSQRPPASP